MIERLAHYSVRAKNLEASTAFYTEALGLCVGPRPPFGFPGVWLYLAQDEARSEHGCVHLIGDGDAAARDGYLGSRPNSDASETGALDHIACDIRNDWSQSSACCKLSWPTPMASELNSTTTSPWPVARAPRRLTFECPRRAHAQMWAPGANRISGRA